MKQKEVMRKNTEMRIRLLRILDDCRNFIINMVKIFKQDLGLNLLFKL